MTMRGEDDVVGPWHMFQQVTDQLGAFTWRCVTDRVRNIDCGRARFDCDFDGAAKIVKFGACGVHRGPLHVVAKIAGVADGLFDPYCHLVFGQVWDRTVQR